MLKTSSETLAMHEFPVDFNARDEDGAVRLTWDSELMARDGSIVQLREGLKVSLTDSELRVTGRLTKRDGLWVVITTEWSDDVP
jgi:hypothetical protein